MVCVFSAESAEAGPGALRSDSKLLFLDRSKTAVGSMLKRSGQPKGLHSTSQSSATSTSEAELFKSYLRDHSRRSRCGWWRRRSKSFFKEMHVAI